ncbi:MAG: polysaccharide biosynthesis/export family protein [Chryseolinea sp.]
MNKSFLTYFLAVIVICCASCSTTRKAIYFNDISDSSLNIVDSELEAVVKPNDILSIYVSSLNRDASDVFNKANVQVTSNNTNTPTTTQSSGYLVSLEGSIEFPLLGNIKVGGLTKKQVKDLLTRTLLDNKLLVNPLVDVRYLNFRVSVMGEVARPSVVTVPSEKISLLEALALAGDLTIYARRDNVMIIREENGKRMIRRIDLNSTEIFSSPYYYLKSNDVVYVEPNRSKVASTRRVNAFLPVVFSFLSLAIIVVTRVNN